MLTVGPAAAAAAAATLTGLCMKPSQVSHKPSLGFIGETHLSVAVSPYA